MGDAEQRAHAERGHLLLVEKLDLDAILHQGLDILGDGLRILDVARLGDQVACDEDAGGEAIVGREGLFSRRRLVEHHGQLAERLLVLVLLLGVILVEAIAAETGAEGDLRRHGGGGQGGTIDRVHSDGAGLRTCRVHLAHSRPAEGAQLAAVDLRRLTEPDQDHGVDLEPMGRDDRRGRPPLALEAAGSKRPADHAAALLVERASGGAKGAILRHTDGDDALGWRRNLGKCNFHRVIHSDDAYRGRMACQRTL